VRRKRNADYSHSSPLLYQCTRGKQDSIALPSKTMRRKENKSKSAEPSWWQCQQATPELVVNDVCLDPSLWRIVEYLRPSNLYLPHKIVLTFR
jgi:hypothetical protein